MSLYPSEYARKLAEYAAASAQRHGLKVNSHSVVSHDPGIDMEKQINRALHEIGADLVVMASQVPGFRDYVFRSHTGTLATHTDLSVLIVR